MNECFIIGEIVSKIQFDFFYQEKQISIAYMNIKLSNHSIVKVYGYDWTADYMYSRLEKGEKIFLYGKLQKDGIEINEIIKLV